MPVDESQKKWKVKMTQEEYDLKVLSPREFCQRYKIKKAEYLERQKKLNS